MLTLDDTLTLEDGRVLAYLQSGDLKGKPLFLFHGLHSSRLEALGVHENMLQNGIHLIAIDRPGIGRSTFLENRTLFDTVDDIITLANHLGFKKFSVLGVFSGGKYALACAYTIPHRIFSCNVIAGSPPMECLTRDMPLFNRFLSV
jgi:pimeloyl-ACP methyl ester carboxylesterase